jgi:hypothetical protein
MFPRGVGLAPDVVGLGCLFSKPMRVPVVIMRPGR